jgi:H+/gluconate symporter-like permease
MGVVGIVLSLVLLMLLAYRGVSMIVLAPLAALFAACFAADAPLLASYTQVFMPALGRFIAAYFPLFLLGAIFGRLMEESGSSAAIANRVAGLLGPRHAVWAIVISAAVLTYAGVSVFVVVFAVYPLAAALFRQADIPKRLLPGAIACGSFTFAMTALPGSVQVHNLIPMKYFGTGPFAAPLPGLVGAAVMLGLGMAWLGGRVAAARRVGEGYGENHRNEPAVDAGRRLPSFLVAVLPIGAVVALAFVLNEFVIGRWDTSYLAQPRFGATKIDAVRGIWATILSLLVAVGLLVVLHSRDAGRLAASVAAAAHATLAPIFTTASEVGYGATIAGLGGFKAVAAAVLGIWPGNPLVSEAVSINLLAGITGSASGGLTIALEALGPTYLERGTAAGWSPEMLHRIAAMSCCGLDTLPHNGAVITLLVICGLTHRQSYADIFVTSVVAPILATIAVVVAGSVLA